MAVWTSPATTDDSSVDLSGAYGRKGNRFETGDSWTDTLKGTTMTQVTARISNSSGSDQDLDCFYAASDDTNIQFGTTQTVPASDSDYTITFTGSQAISSSLPFMVYFMNGTSLALIISTGVTAPNVWKGATSSTTWSNWEEYTGPTYQAPMTITYSAPPPPSSSGTRLPPAPLIARF